MTRNQARKIAELVTVNDLKSMFVSAYTKVDDWSKPSKVNKGATIGVTFNILSSFGIDENTSILIKINMIREFGEFLPNYIKPDKSTKKSYNRIHQSPKPLDKSFYV